MLECIYKPYRMEVKSLMQKDKLWVSGVLKSVSLVQ